MFSNSRNPIKQNCSFSLISLQGELKQSEKLSINIGPSSDRVTHGREKLIESALRSFIGRRCHGMVRDMAKQHDPTTYSAEETAQRAEAVIKRMLNTPPQPRRAKEKPTNAKERPGRKTRVKPPS
jgi:hypothetical protein